LDNLGGSSANRVTSANADSLNNTGAGSETDSGSITINAVTLSTANLPPLTFTTGEAYSASGSMATSGVWGTGNVKVTTSTNTIGSGSSFTPTGSFTGTTGANTQPWISEGRIIRAL